MCKFNFGAFFKVMKGAFARCFSDPTLCQLLFDSILVPCGWPQVISKETASKLKNNKINIPEMYRDGLTFISDDTMQAYFREQIVPKLEKLKISHMIGELIQIVQNDTSIDSDTKTRILQNASYESLDAFLALLFHLSLVTENKTIVSKASRQNISVHQPRKPVSTHLMPQRLTIQNQQEILLDSENFDFTKLFHQRRILIEAPGGQGKSTFLKRLEAAACLQNCFSYVLRLSFTDLLPQDEREMIPFSMHSFRYAGSNYMFKWLFHQKDLYADQKFNYDQIVRCATGSDDPPILLLLDGFNELLATSNISVIQTIRSEIHYITEHWLHAVILITSRPLRSLDGQNPTCYRELNPYISVQLSGVPDSIYHRFEKAHRNLNPEILSLAKIPMYFNMLQEFIISDLPLPSTQYQLFHIMYNRLRRQALDKYEMLKPLYYLIYHIIAPSIAQEMCHAQTNRFKEIQIESIINRLFEHSHSMNARFRYITNLADDALMYEVPSKSLQILRTLTSEGLLLCDHGSYCFQHDDWRDFLAAYSIVSDIQLLSFYYEEESIAKEIDINLNATHSVAKMIKEALHLCGDEQSVKKSFSELFDNLSHRSAHSSIGGVIQYAYIAAQIVEYLQVETNLREELHKLLSDVCAPYLWHLDQGTPCLAQLSNPWDINRIIAIIGKECEYHRRRSRYQTALHYVALGEAIDDCTYIQHHKAKIDLYHYQDFILHNPIAEPVAHSLQECDALYEKGVELLHWCADEGCDISLNLFGMLHETPAPYLMREKIHFINHVEAFYAYFRAVFFDQNSNLYGRDIAYPICQAVNLLINGYVKIKPNYSYIKGTFLIQRNDLIAGDRNPLRIDRNTLTLADDMLHRIDGQALPLLNYLRGCVALLLGKRATAEQYFQSYSDFRRENLLMYFIRFNYEFNGHFNLTPEYENLKNAIQQDPNGVVDRCHPIYWYANAKLLELAYDPGRIAFFDAFEKILKPDHLEIVKQMMIEK